MPADLTITAIPCPASTTRNKVRVAAIQMVTTPRIEDNLEEAGRLVRLAADKGAKLIVLPEYFGIMGMKDTDKVAAAEQDGHGPIQDFLQRTARQLDIWLAGGSVPLVSSNPDRIRNSCLLYDHTGNRVARYDKIHLFGFEQGIEYYKEAETIEAGDRIVSVDSPFGRIGLSVCYDLRFPELFRAMNKVDIILAPSAFTETTGKAHWETLIRARAIENLAYVIAPGQGGHHANGRNTYGNSMIVDPWGTVLDRLALGSGIAIADIDPAYQAGLRNNLPALEHRTIHSC